MSKNNNNQRMKQCIREQQRQIERLKHLNKDMGITLNEMHLHELQQFSDVLSCVFAQCMMDVITEEQAGRLMVALTGVEVQYIGNTKGRKREPKCGKIEARTTNHHKGVLHG